MSAGEKMKLKLISCEVFRREIGLVCAKSKNTFDIAFLRQGLHAWPSELGRAIQEEIDLAESSDGDFDAVILGVGLCGGGLSGVGSKKYLLVAPRAHDCITLLLGSKERYREYFDAKSGGVYWYSPGWIENYHRTDMAKTGRGWAKNYCCAAFIDFPGIEGGEYREYAKKSAKALGLEFIEYKGSDSLLLDLLDGKWDEERFLTVPPGKKVAPSYGGDIIKAV
jgi:hypothetical protein